jgi:hypothetical protein
MGTVVDIAVFSSGTKIIASHSFTFTRESEGMVVKTMAT